MIDGQSSAREPFEVVDPIKIDLKSYRIRGQGKCPPIYNFFIIGISIGLFAYVNTFFLYKIGNVMNGTVANIATDTFDCQNYFCNEAAYNYINFNTFYQNCNYRNCNITCTNFTCNDISSYDPNYYYSCGGMNCTGQGDNIPSSVTSSFIMAIVAACTFGLAMVIAIVYGLIAAFCSQNLNTMQKVGLGLSFIWPRFKYYAFRRRQYWQNFYFDLKCMVIIDFIINILYGVTLGLYIALETNSFWQSGAQIACFYLLIYATIGRASMMAQVSAPFFAASRQIRQYREIRNI